MRICKSCVLPENFPHVIIGADGICNYCKSFKGRGEIERLKVEYCARLAEIIKRRAGNGEYDVLTCYSGGKDSTYTLGLLKNRYKLRILAMTLDNGFVPPRTYINIRNVVEKLDVDHIFFKPRFEILKKVFRASIRACLYPPKTLERAGTICTSCMGFIKYVAIKTAIEKEIPLIAFGWSPGQAPVTSSVLEINPLMMKSMEGVLKRPMRELCGGDIEAYFLNDRHYSKPKRFPAFIHPLALVNYDEKKILGEIKKLGWKRPPGVELNATNCYLNPFADEVHIGLYKFHPYALEIANMVREGYMKRAEGLRHLPFQKNKKIVRWAKKRLGL